MRISFQNLPKDHISLLTRLTLNFKLGELLDAKVVKVGPERALLEIKGQNVLAEVRTNLKPGDTLKVRVAGELQNQVILKVLDDPQAKTAQADQLVKHLGSAPSPETRAALTFLLKNGLPVTPETLRALTTDKNYELHQLLLKSFGDTPATATKTGSQESSLFDKLKNVFSGGKQETPPQETPGATKEQPAPAKQNTETALKASGEKQNTENKDTSHGLKDGKTPEIRQDVTPFRPTKPAVGKEPAAPLKPEVENKQEALNKAGNQTKTPDTRQSTALSQQILAEVKSDKATLPSSKNLLQQAKPSPTGAAVKPDETNPRTGLNRTPETTPTSTSPATARLEQSGLLLNPAKGVGSLISEIKTLAQSLGLLKKDDTEPGVKTSLSANLPTPLSEEQKEGLRELNDKMVGMRLKQSEEGTLLHMEIPLLINQKPTTALLHIKKDGGNAAYEQVSKPLSILLKLNTDDLGQLKALILLHNKEMHCQFSAEREDTRMLLRKFMPELTDKLKNMDLKVEHVSVMPLVEDEEKEEPMPGQVDFRV